MKVSIRFDKASQPVKFDKVLSTYQKGALFCVRLQSQVTYKYPLASIFDIKESEAVDSAYAESNGDKTQKKKK